MSQDSPAAILFDITGSDISSIADGSILRLAVDARAAADTRPNFVDWTSGDIIGPSLWTVLIDVDDRGGVGPYKHASGSTIVLKHGRFRLTKSSPTSRWKVRLGVILDIDGTSADIAIFESLTLALENAGDLHASSVLGPHPFQLDLAASLTGLTQGLTPVETVTAVNTGAMLPDATGTSITPAIGDLLIHIEKLSGGGGVTANVQALVFYTVS